MIAFDITTLSAELRSSDSVRYRSKTYISLYVFVWAWLPETHTVKVKVKVWTLAIAPLT